MSFLLETKNLSKRFVKHLDLAARMARKIGAEVQEEIVQAVDRVDPVSYTHLTLPTR